MSMFSQSVCLSICLYVNVKAGLPLGWKAGKAGLLGKSHFSGFRLEKLENMRLEKLMVETCNFQNFLHPWWGEFKAYYSHCRNVNFKISSNITIYFIISN